MGFKVKLHRSLADVSGLEGTGHVRIGCRVSRNANLSIPNGGNQALAWDAEQFDTHGFHPAGGTTLTIPTGLDMIYLIVFRIRWAAGEVGYRQHTLTAAGYDPINVFALPTSQPAGPKDFAYSAVLPLVAGNTVVLTVGQTQGAPLNLLGDGDPSLGGQSYLALMGLQTV